MYAAIRVYKVRRDKLAEFDRAVQQDFVPIVSKLPGYVAYFGIDQGDGKWASISIFQTQEAASASTGTAADFVQKRLKSYIESGPDVIMGSVVAGGATERALEAGLQPR